MSNYELHYFPVRGRAEPIRMILEFTGTKYDVKVPENWPEEKRSTPYGQLPILKFKEGGKQMEIAQSQAIIRFLAAKNQLFPEDLVQRAHVDSLVEAINENSEKLGQILYGVPPQHHDEARREFKPRIADPFNEVISKFITKHGGSGYCVGQKTTVADIVLFAYMSSVCEFAPGAFSATASPVLWKVYEKVASNKSLQAYFSSPRRYPK